MGGHVRSRRRRLLLDLLVGGLLLLVTLPIALVLAVGSVLTFRAWPIFTQQRLGRCGRPFLFAKIRSLPPSAPKYANKYEIRRLSKTRFGRFIRSTHLDELPQLFLVLSGRMSLVGPRPEMEAVAATFDPEFVVRRLQLRPGCTGLWQISVKADHLIGECPEYDLFYAEHCCIRLDLWILWRTAVQLLPGVEPIALEDIPRWVLPRPNDAPLLPVEVPQLPTVAPEAAE
jgi:lipopolysaccharide/colanic/teichoic acid biosynthesis glycosyltransferase